MTLLSTLKSRKALAGMVAVATGTATVAAPVVALPLSPAANGDATGSPAVNGADAGTYESCSELFGLTDKSNANYVTFNVEGTADPLPDIGQGLTPVITVTDPESGDVDECTPEIGFDDEASWRSYLFPVGFPVDAANGNILNFFFPYPGTTGYLVPGGAGIPSENSVVLSEMTPSATTPPASLTLRVEADSTVSPALTVTWEPSELTFRSLDDEFFNDFDGTITEQLGGPSSPLAARFLQLVDLDGGFSCSEPPEQIDIELAAALIRITGVPVSLFEETFGEDFEETCDQIAISTELLFVESYLAGFGLPATVTVNAPTPTPTPTPVVPRFTG